MPDFRKGRLYRIDDRDLAIFLYSRSARDRSRWPAAWEDPTQEEEMIFKIIEGPRKGDEAVVSSREDWRLSGPLKRKKKRKRRSFISRHQYFCPTCQTPYPHYQSGIRCPGCGEMGECMNFKQWLEASEIYSDDGVGEPNGEPDKIDVINQVVGELEALAKQTQWPVEPSRLQDISDRLRNVGIRPVDIDAAIGTTDPNLQWQYLITGPSSGGGAGQGALNDLRKMLE